MAMNAANNNSWERDRRAFELMVQKDNKQWPLLIISVGQGTKCLERKDDRRASGSTRSSKNLNRPSLMWAKADSGCRVSGHIIIYASSKFTSWTGKSFEFREL
ncbi:hypothetical protein ACU8KH_01758 [Lachancea thermotolerans]